MKLTPRLSHALLAAGLGISVSCGALHAADTGPYKILNTTQTMGTGNIDYVYADSAGRRLYVPRGNEVLVFDLDTLKQAGSITNARARGAAVDPKSHHGFCSSSPVVMWDTQTLATIKTIPVTGNPDGIFFEPFSGRVCVLSHSAPNVTLIDPKDGTVVGTIDLGGMPEQAASDGKGHMYVDLEDRGKVAVVDVKTMQKTGEYDLGGKGQPAGLAMDAKNGILFAMCRQPATCVIMNAGDGTIITNLAIGNGTDGGGFNPDTMEAFSSQGQNGGVLTIIKEKSPTSFEVEQNLATKNGAKTCTLDAKTGHILLIATEAAPAPPAAAAPATNAATPPAGGNQPGGRRGGGRGGPAFLDVIVVGK